jgi:hypothetical protein
MQSVRVRHVGHGIPWITALVALGGLVPPVPMRPARLTASREPVVAIVQSAEGVGMPDNRPVVVLRFVIEEPSVGPCVATVAIVNAPPVPPDTALTTHKSAEARRQRRKRLLEWGIQTLRVLDAVLQAARALLK